jgi:hypothetical protein
MFFAIPPLVILVPAIFAFGIQIATAFFRFAAVFAFVMDRPVQPCFRFFNGVLALCAVVRVGPRNRSSHKERQGDCCNECMDHLWLQVRSPLGSMPVENRMDGIKQSIVTNTAAWILKSSPRHIRYSASGIFLIECFRNVKGIKSYY